MARKKEPIGVSNIQVLSYLKSGTVAPRIDEIYTMDPWVHFGRRNDFPEKMRTLVDNCAPLERCIHTCAMLIAGNGVKFYDKEGEEIEEAVAAFDSLMEGTTQEEFLFSSAYDIAFLKARSWGLRRAFGSAIVRLDHVDVMRVRSEDIDEETGNDGAMAYWVCEELIEWMEKTPPVVNVTHQAPAQAPLTGMSEMNRTIAYCAAAKLRELGYEWDESAAAWGVKLDKEQAR
jgi:hypothetical protein